MVDGGLELGGGGVWGGVGKCTGEGVGGPCGWGGAGGVGGVLRGRWGGGGERGRSRGWGG
jgi:hypothetical protein